VTEKPKVLIADAMSPQAADILRARGIEVDVETGLTAAELKERIGRYDGLAIRSGTRVTEDLLGSAARLRVVGRAGIGVDNVDVEAATNRGVVVMNTPTGNAVTTAEHTIAMMLALARRIPQANASTRAGKWEKSAFLGVEVTGKTLGLIGCGNVGSIVADRAQGLRMKVIAYDPFLSPDRAKTLGVEKVGLDELLARSDFISLHAPLNESTKGMIDASALSKTKTGVRIINCARGGLIVEADLEAALESGHVAGAALDVFETEPAKENPLFALEQVVATPHLGASTAEAQEKVAIQIAEQMAEFLLAGTVINSVNMPAVGPEEAPLLRPYLKLARQLGSFAGQVTRTGLKAVVLEYEGRAAELDTRIVTAAALEGLLAPLVDQVNLVSAPAVAKARGIEVTEVKREQPRAYSTLMRLTVTTETRSRGLAGTLFDGERPRIVEIKGIPIDAELGPHMLYVTNEDKPGFIGALGTALGAAGINIATFQLGRTGVGEQALALIEVDQPVGEAVLERLRGLPHVVDVRALRF
jgi:D-3-phosphoglycerate dehydrogenase